MLIAGNCFGRYSNECIALVKESGLEKDVLFLGYRKDVYKLMEEATALVVSSRFEGFGFITVEAMYNHCLVIGKNTAGTKEQFDVGRALTGHEIGIRYDKDDELIDCLERATQLSEGERLKIINRAYETVKKSYTIDTHFENVMNFYKRVINA